MVRKSPPPAPKGNKYAVGNSGLPPVYTQEWLIEEAENFREWMKKEDSIFFKSFCVERGYSPQRLTEFSEKCPEFSEVYKLAKDWQEQKIITTALWNKTNSGMAKFVLANHHGYVEKTQVSGDAANPLQFLLERSDGNSKELVNEQE